MCLLLDAEKVYINITLMNVQSTIFIGVKRYAYQVYRKRGSEDVAIFSASLNHPMYFQVNTQLIKS